MEPTDPSAQQQAVAVPQLPADQAIARVVAGAVLVDVREPVEWDAGHAPTARLVPMSAVPSGLADLPRAETVLVICRSGVRSHAAAEVMRAAGIDAWNVSGGMRSWAAADGIVVRSDGSDGVVV